MQKCNCENCICLIDNDDKWFCDELGKEITEIKKCPEQTELKEYSVIIHEVLSHCEVVKAKSSQEAKQKVIDMYYNEEIVLGEEHFAYREIRDADNDDEYEEF